MAYNPNIPNLYVGYTPPTNYLQTSWDILVSAVNLLILAIGLSPPEMSVRVFGQVSTKEFEFNLYIVMSSHIMRIYIIKVLNEPFVKIFV